MSNPLPKDTPEINPLDIYGDIRRIKRIFYTFSSVISIAILVTLAPVLFAHDFLLAVLMGATLPLILISFIFVYKNQFEKATIFLAIVLFSLITIVSTFGLGIHNIAVIGFPAILIVASLVIHKRTHIFLTLFAIICVAWLVFGEVLDLYTPEVLVKSIPGDFISASVIIITTSVMVRLLVGALFEVSLEVKKELSERKRAEKRLAYDATHDALTGLPNRTLFYDRLSQRLERSRRHPEELFAILYIDLDRFKVVNDSLGHAVGDKLLIVTAKQLTQSLRPEDTVSRLSGDEFAILLNDFKETNDAVRVAERIHAQLKMIPLTEDINWVPTASIGIAIFDGNYTDPQEIMRDADSAMYHAKSMGGGHHKIFDTSMYTSAMTLLQLETDLKRAVENQEWLVYYQPIVSAPDRIIVGVEALVRWQHPQRGIITPDDFIHVAEETGLIIPIGEYVMREACKQVKIWRENKQPDLRISVNLSGRQFEDQNLLSTIKEILSDTGLPGKGLHLEITESVAMKDFSSSIKLMHSLEEMGIQISFDDFGIGHSSLGYLNRFPIKVLKIDRSFIKDIQENQSSEALYAAIISMGHALNLEVIAEGVETESQLAFLQSISCDKIQGFLISRAVPAEELEKLL
jgi:diguanylate cyclase (GGDEF)-like protein